MRLSDGGYSECQFNRDKFLARIEDLKMAIPELLRRGTARKLRRAHLQVAWQKRQAKAAAEAAKAAEAG